MIIIDKDKKEAAKKLKELAFSYSKVNDMVFGFSSYGFQSIKVPEHNGHEKSEILISGQFYRLYKKFLKFLESQKKLEYMLGDSKSKMFVEGEINLFIYDVLFDKKYRDIIELNNRIETLLASIYRPLENYKVVIPIKYFDTYENNKFEIEDSVISRLDLDKIKQDSVASHPDYESLHKYWSKFENNYCITVNEDGNNINLIIERARKKASEYLDFLRLYFYEMPYRTFAARYFKISDGSFIYDSNGVFKGSFFIRDEKDPLFDKLNEECVNRLYESINKLQKFQQIENAKTKERIKRTIHWIGKAVSEFDLDVSLILYCTALESLLIPESEGKKGEELALRVALIEKKMYNAILNPSSIYNIYEIRSKVVHGSEHEISRKEFITDLELFISRVLYPFTDFACSNPRMKPLELMQKLENFDDILEVFLLTFFHSDTFENSIKFKEYILNHKLLGDSYLKFTNKGIKKYKQIPDNVLDKFFQAAKSDNPYVRRSAVFSLGFLKEYNVVDLLNKILIRDEDTEVRKHAALSLGRIKNQEYTSSELLSLEPTSIELLIQMLSHENEGLREKSATALGSFSGPEIKEVLIKSLKDNSAEVRATSARSLGFIGDESAFIPLLKALEDEDYRVICSVSVALGKLKDPRAIEHLNIARSRKIYSTQEAIDWAINEINK